MKYLKVILILLLIPIAFPVFAAESGTVDLMPAIDYVLKLLAGVVVPVLIFLITRELNRRFKVQLSAEHKANLQDALERATSYGIGKVRQVAGDIAKIEVKNKLVAESANYAIARVPDAVAYFGYSEEKIKEMILSRLEDKTGS